MKKSSFINKLISAIFITIILIYFMLKTTSPKIIFIPFLICSTSMVGKYIALILNNRTYAALLNKLFIFGFLLFWFGFLVMAGYISVRDHNYSLLIFSLPFWLVGIYLTKQKLLNITSKNEAKSKFNFMMMISAGLVIITLLSGLIISVLGIIERNATMIFAGAFFTFGALTFVLVALTVLGYFDKLKIDLLGLYIGILFVVIGIGFIAFKYIETASLLKTIQTFGIWIFIPILLVVAGVLQITKCLKNRR